MKLLGEKDIRQRVEQLAEGMEQRNEPNAADKQALIDLVTNLLVGINEIALAAHRQNQTSL
jgi:phenylpyruvate tautomerase PptA (4-oxalocrotonate tautomerase family)